MRETLRQLLRFGGHLYPREHGKYSILQRLYFPYAAPRRATDQITRLRSGFVMALDLTEYVQAYLYVFGSYELPSMKIVRSILSNGGVMIDVGAQIGYVTLEGATASPNVHVIAVEPESKNIARLQRNVGLNNFTNVSIEQTALGSSEGVLRLYLSNDENAGTHSALSENANVSDSYIEVPVQRMDDLVRRRALTAVDIIKIDVEGFEEEVLAGSTATIEQFAPTFLIELSDALQAARGSTTQRIKHWMHERGYGAFTIHDDATLSSCALESGHVNDNVLFVHHARMESLRTRLTFRP
jgi:FkbM family methyltransferase